MLFAAKPFIGLPPCGPGIEGGLFGWGVELRVGLALSDRPKSHFERLDRGRILWEELGHHPTRRSIPPKLLNPLKLSGALLGGHWMPLLFRIKGS